MKAFGFVALGLLLSGVASAQMALPGKFEVTDTGSASYTIPISIVPGTAGLEPKLSLQYDSRGGNGLLGIGWSLAGLPAITRCGRAIAQDGVTGGVAYDANDRFCLDGQRLIATSGTYGADQTEYRTERESFSKVVSYGTAGSGPSWFKVWTKAGLVMEFGNTADSRIEAQGKASVRVWAINKTSDTKGNYFSVSYTEDNANGEYRPSRIDYTGNGSTAPSNSVRFVYEARPDIVPLYQAGSLIKTTQRMTRVQAWQGANMVREYRIAYQTSSATLDTRVTSVQHCDAGSVCLPATTLSWADGVNGYAVVQSIGADATTFNTYNATVSGDFNGDGKADILWCYHDSSGRCSGPTAPIKVWLAGSNGAFTVVTNVAPDATTIDYKKAVTGDYNGDGMTDILWCHADGYGRCMGDGAVMEIWLSKGDGTFNVVTNLATDAGTIIYKMPITGDFNGDGRTDIMWCHQDGYHRCNAASWPPLEIWQSKGDGTFDIVTNLAPGADAMMYKMPILGDYNGDGKTDIIWCHQDGYGRCNAAGAPPLTMWLAKGDGVFDAVINLAADSDTLMYKMPITGDFNGDGKTDIIWCHQDGYNRCNAASAPPMEMWMSKGDGTFNIVTNLAADSDTIMYQRPMVGDYNGDGKADILWCFQDILGQCLYYTSSTPYTTYELWVGNGDGTFRIVNNVAANAATLTAMAALPGDYNGDGKTDILWCGQDGSGRCVSSGVPFSMWVANGAAAPAVSEVVSAVTTTSVTALVYAPLSQGGALYTKDTGSTASTYPCLDMQGSLYVVSEVKSSNGLGGEYRSTYRYAGAKADQHGRGFLGFRQMTVRDEQTGVEQVTSYRQDYPFAGLVASREKKLGAQLLNRSTNTYGSTDLGGTRRYPFLTQSLEESWELGGAALPAVTTSYQYDAFGNATQVTVSTGDGHSKTTTNSYSNDVPNWLLGRLTRSEVTSVAP